MQVGRFYVDKKVVEGVVPPPPESSFVALRGECHVD